MFQQRSVKKPIGVQKLGGGQYDSGLDQFSTFPSNGTQEDIKDAQRYQQRVNWYTQPPDTNISIEEFESFALDRLQLLQEIEILSIKAITSPEHNILATQGKNKGEGDRMSVVEQKIIEATRKFKLYLSSNSTNWEQTLRERRKDHISHYILRLSFSRSEELMRWFVKQETLLFKARLYNQISSNEASLIVGEAELQVEEIVDIEDKEKVANIKFYNKSYGRKLYYVDFEKVVDLVYRRKVVVVKGRAIISQDELKILLVEKFKRQIEEGIWQCHVALPRLDSDERIQGILENMSGQYQIGKGDEYGGGSGGGQEIGVEDIEDVSKHFPPCMRYIKMQLDEHSHLRHFARLQYGLFLKGIGLKLPEALAYWKQKFGRKVTADKFDKEYAYNIRHSYGVEGKRANYTPYSCARILSNSGPMGNRDCHGCPFKTFEEKKLKMYLSTIGTCNDEILRLAKTNHYQVACTRFLEAQTHSELEGITHPNKYFDISRGNSAGPN